MKIVTWRDTNTVLWEGEAGSIGEAVIAALKAGADLTGADLTGADLTGADLRDADLTGADLTPIRDDLWAVLSAAPAEVSGLLAAIHEGRIDGSAYTGTCACLVGTIANIRGCEYTALSGLSANSGRPAERFFLAIKPGDTPDTNASSKLAAEWVTDWLARMSETFGPKPETISA